MTTAVGSFKERDKETEYDVMTRGIIHLGIGAPDSTLLPLNMIQEAVNQVTVCFSTTVLIANIVHFSLHRMPT